MLGLSQHKLNLVKNASPETAWTLTEAPYWRVQGRFNVRPSPLTAE